MTDIVTENYESTGLYKKKTRFAYYLAIVGIHMYMSNWARSLSPVSFGKHLCYLTNMSFYLNFIYYTYVSLLHTPIRESIKNYNLLRGMFKFAYSLSFVVFVLYWLLVFGDRESLAKKEQVIPFCLDIFLHGTNYVLNLLEHVYLLPRSDSPHINYPIYTLFIFSYGCLLQFLYHVYGIVVYPFVERSLGSFSIVILAGLGLILLGDFTYKMLLKKHHKN